MPQQLLVRAPGVSQGVGELREQLAVQCTVRQVAVGQVVENVGQIGDLLGRAVPA
jgi:hypothetical protein